MRDRKDILESRRQTLQNCTEASLWHTKQSITQEAILEVLFDIRDLLLPRKTEIKLPPIEVTKEFLNQGK